ncbi:hypothetical protein D3C72_939290 [compost metagenome]
MVLQVGRRRAQHLLQRRQAACDQPRIFQLGADAQGDVEAFADRIEQPVFHHQVERKLRMLLQETWQQRRQRAQRERLRCIDAQASAHFTALLGDAALQGVQLIEQAAAFAVIGMAGFGQAHAAGGSLQQHHAQVRFQRAQLLAQPGWRQAQVFGGAGQAAAFDDAAEGTHQGEGVHAGPGRDEAAIVDPRHARMDDARCCAVCSSRPSVRPANMQAPHFPGCP